MRIAVYYNSGNKAIYNLEDVEFTSSKPVIDGWKTLLAQKRVIVNMENVCFAKPIEEKVEED